MLAGLLKPDGGQVVPQLNVSYKPQKIAPSFEGSVRSLLHKKVNTTFVLPQFQTDVCKPLMLDTIIDQEARLSLSLSLSVLTQCLVGAASVWR
jgi:ATP-binding cassette subfamily E protein 1